MALASYYVVAYGAQRQQRQAQSGRGLCESRANQSDMMALVQPHLVTSMMSTSRKTTACLLSLSSSKQTKSLRLGGQISLNLAVEKKQAVAVKLLSSLQSSMCSPFLFVLESLLLPQKTLHSFDGFYWCLRQQQQSNSFIAISIVLYFSYRQSRAVVIHQLSKAVRLASCLELRLSGITNYLSFRYWQELVSWVEVCGRTDIMMGWWPSRGREWAVERCWRMRDVQDTWQQWLWGVVEVFWRSVTSNICVYQRGDIIQLGSPKTARARWKATNKAVLPLRC